MIEQYINKRWNTKQVNIMSNIKEKNIYTEEKKRLYHSFNSSSSLFPLTVSKTESNICKFFFPFRSLSVEPFTGVMWSIEVAQKGTSLVVWMCAWRPENPQRRPSASYISISCSPVTLGFQPGMNLAGRRLMQPVFALNLFNSCFFVKEGTGIAVGQMPVFTHSLAIASSPGHREKNL